MATKEKKELNPRCQWTKFAVATILYLLFLVWVESWWGLIVVPFIFDVYITKKIKWQWWRESPNDATRFIMSWVDALVFALVAVYFINLFFFQNYVIPSSSLEKSLLTGDYLFVSKVSYGPRKPQTPLTMPLTQHTLPVIDCDSYIEWPQWKYERAKGFGHVELNDIVVFNYPAGDTICTAPQYQAQDFYRLAYGLGEGAYAQTHGGYLPNLSQMPRQQQRDFFAQLYADGRRIIGTMCLYRQDRKPETSLEWHDHIKSITAYINQHPTEDLSLRRLAMLGQTTPSKLARAFGKILNTTPAKYVTTVRLNLARNLLEETDQSLTDIAQAAGFYDFSHFFHTFRRARGLTPAQYRARHHSV